MIEKHHVEGYEKFREFITNLKSDGKAVLVYFGGSKLPTGQSWCGDCVRAQPIIESKLSKLPEDSDFVYVEVEVGDQTFWEDPNCPFRNDSTTKLEVLPTLVRWGNPPQKLEGKHCERPGLVELFTYFLR